MMSGSTGYVCRPTYVSQCFILLLGAQRHLMPDASHIVTKRLKQHIIFSTGRRRQDLSLILLWHHQKLLVVLERCHVRARPASPACHQRSVLVSADWRIPHYISLTPSRRIADQTSIGSFFVSRRASVS